MPEDGRFRATTATRGPWSDAHQHGGPPSALLGRALEAAVGEGFVAARFTIELLRPVPIGLLAVETSAPVGGASVRRVEGALLADGIEILRGVGLFVATRPGAPAVAPEILPLLPPSAAAAETEFPFFRCDEGYHRAIELRYVHGKNGDPSVAVWMRSRIRLVAGEVPTGAQRVLLVADSGNGVTAPLDLQSWSFVNPDLTVHLHRAVAGEWIALEAEMRTDPSGTGLAQTRIHDARGLVGCGAQSLVVRARRPG